MESLAVGGLESRPPPPLAPPLYLIVEGTSSNTERVTAVKS
jgi:hypothetical protein